MKKRAAIYCRISQDRTGGGLGVDRQRADCEALAKKLDWSVVDVFVDNDVSAYSGKRRAGYQQLLAALKDGRANAVLAWHTDRLHRSPVELEEYLDICEPRKVVTHTVQAGELDLSTPSGRMVARMLGAAARYEVEHKSARTKRAQSQAAAAGKWLGGAPPIGWNLRSDGTATLDRKAANRIKRATADVIAGVSLGTIVTAWNAEGFTTGTGKPWNYTSLRQVLTRARNAGKVEYNGEIVAESLWPSIVTENQWRAVCAVVRDPKRRRSQSNRAKWLLAGIARCGKEGCGQRLKSASAVVRTGGTRTVYRCVAPGSGHVARDAIALDRYIEGVAVEWLEAQRQAGVRAERPGDTDGTTSEATAVRARLKDAAQSYADNKLTIAQLTLITEQLTGELEQIESAGIRLQRGTVLAEIQSGDDAATTWRGLSLERRRSIIDTFMHISVLPSGRRGKDFDGDLIAIDWLH